MSHRFKIFIIACLPYTSIGCPNVCILLVDVVVIEFPHYTIYTDFYCELLVMIYSSVNTITLLSH